MSTILYINPLTKNIQYFIFDSKKNILETNEIIWIDVSISLPEKIAELTKKYDFSEIWCIEGPWPFTKMRILSLTLNTLVYTKSNIKIKWCHFFDLLSFFSKKTPILEANKKEYLVRENGENIFYLKENLPKNKYIWYTSEIYELSSNFDTYIDNVDNIFSFFDTVKTKSRFSPLYIKKPHITCPKK